MILFNFVVLVVDVRGEVNFIIVFGRLLISDFSFICWIVLVVVVWLIVVV